MKRKNTLGTLALAQTVLAAPNIVHMSAYANELNPIIQDLYAALDVVSREMVGFIPSVARNATAERAAVGQQVVWEVAQEQEAFDITPSMHVPEPPDHASVTKNMVLTKQQAVIFGFTGEEQRAVNNSQPGWLSHQAGIFAMALRKLVNMIERDLAVEAAANGSRAWGTPGVTPFEAGVRDMAQIRKILDDNGAPITGRTLVVDSAAGANLRSNHNLVEVNKAGTQMTLRDGELLQLAGISVKESGQAVMFNTGSGDFDTDGGVYAVGATRITVTGTGDILAGDVIQFAGDSNKYVVEVGRAGAGEIRISAPGLRLPITGATAITLATDYTANVAFSYDALQLAVRAPAIPTVGDLRIDSMVITDPRSGLAFEVSIWPGHRKVRCEVAAVWGVKAVKREHIALLLG